MRIKHLLFCVLLVAGISCTKKPAEYPMFWTWLEDLPEIDMETAFTHMEEAGLDAVMLHAASLEDYRKDVEIARRHGITVYAWVWTLNPPRQERAQLMEEHPDWFSVNRNGESTLTYKAYVSSYKFLCPILPEVQSYLVQKVKDICAVDGIEGICIDYCRLVDRVLPISLAYNYGLFQDGEVFPEYDFGYHPAMLAAFQAEYGYDPREKEDPSRDEAWNQFRCDRITDVANLLCDAAHAAGKAVTASTFSGEGVSRFMVFQDWGKWKLDLAHPMAYTDFYTMDPSFARDATLQNQLAKAPGTTLMCGVDTELGGDPERIVPALKNLAERSRYLILVTNDLFSDGITYSPSVQAYLRKLAEINRQAAEMADRVVEVVYSIPVILRDCRSQSCSMEHSMIKDSGISVKGEMP